MAEARRPTGARVLRLRPICRPVRGRSGRSGCVVVSRRQAEGHLRSLGRFARQLTTRISFSSKLTRPLPGAVHSRDPSPITIVPRWASTDVPSHELLPPEPYDYRHRRVGGTREMVFRPKRRGSPSAGCSRLLSGGGEAVGEVLAGPPHQPRPATADVHHRQIAAGERLVGEKRPHPARASLQLDLPAVGAPVDAELLGQSATVSLSCSPPTMRSHY